MDFRLDENQQMYFDMVTKFVKNEIIPFSMTWDKEHAFPWKTIQKA